MKVVSLALASVLAAAPVWATDKSKDPSCADQVSSGQTAKSSFAHDFLKMKDDEVALRLLKEYPEMIVLTGDVDASPFGITLAHPEKPLASERLFGKAHAEFDRTVAGVLVLKWFMSGNYDQLVSVQKPEVRLSRQRFDEIAAYIKKVVHNKESLNAMIISMVINDLGKVTQFAVKAKKETGVESVDHDIVLLAALNKDKAVSSSFSSLSKHYKAVMMKGLEAKFNLGQFVQSENVAASLEGMKSLVGDQESADFFLVHALIDIGGVAGAKTQDGSMLLTEPLATSFFTGIEALRGFGQGKSSEQVYEDFIEFKGRMFSLNSKDRLQRTAIRLATMLGLTNSRDAHRVVEALEALPRNTLAILQKEMSLSGVDDGTAILIYYAPAIVSNVRAAIDKTGGDGLSAESLEIGFTTLARIYQESRIRLAGTQKNGVYTVFAKSVAEAAANPQSLDAKNLVIEGDKVDLRDPTEISLKTLNPVNRLSQKVTGLIGVGGGSDGIQAAQLAQILKGHGSSVKFVISVRTAKTQSLSASGAQGEERTVNNHGGEIFRGVFKVLPSTSGSGNFMENLPAADVPMFIVTDYQDGTLLKQIQSVIQNVGGVQEIVTVDTGGDSLYSTAGTTSNAKATPDQDLRVLSSLTGLNMPVTSAVIAVGIDSPANAAEVLQKAKAQRYSPTSNETLAILAKYRAWKMDGASNSRKTALAWQAALMGQIGLQSLNIPSRYVLDAKNPWSPFVRINESMRDIVFMNLTDHLRAIGAYQKPSGLNLSEAQRAALINMTSVGPVENLFRYDLQWTAKYIASGRLLRMTNPMNPFQNILIKAAHPGERFDGVSPAEAKEFLAAVEAGRSYTFKSIAPLLADSFQLSQKEIDLILARKESLTRILLHKGWTEEAIKKGDVYEFGDGWYKADWVFKLTSIDGSMTITDAPDFNPYTLAELVEVQRAMGAKFNLVTARARAALEPGAKIIPGENPRANPPPRY